MPAGPGSGVFVDDDALKAFCDLEAMVAGELGGKGG